MTRDELIEIINNEVYIEDNYGSYHEIAGVSDAADAILAKLESDTKWQPIETAPKDGTPILVLEPEVTDGATGSVEPGIMLVEFREYELYSTNWTGWCVPGSWQDEQGGYCEANRPTHWMPLPEPPK